MGENTGFATRNNTIISLVQTAGGGTITAVTPNNQTQTIQAPFTGPNAVTTITFLASAASPSPGFGGAVTKDGLNFASSIAWGPGSLSNAKAGTLIVVFDVNFMQAGADANSQAFLKNLIAFLAAPTPFGAPTTVPALSTWSMGLLLAGFVALVYRLTRAKQAA